MRYGPHRCDCPPCRRGDYANHVVWWDEHPNQPTVTIEVNGRKLTKPASEGFVRWFDAVMQPIFDRIDTVTDGKRWVRRDPEEE
jgi:hypothetical protein